jgi:hypothetical protein
MSQRINCPQLILVMAFIHLEFEEGEEDSVACVLDPDGCVFKIGQS